MESPRIDHTEFIQMGHRQGIDLAEYLVDDALARMVTEPEKSVADILLDLKLALQEARG